MKPCFLEGLELIGNSFDGSWTIVGDFNMVLNQRDKLGGRLVGNPSNGGLHKLVDDFGLIDMEFKGQVYTQSNQRSELANIQERLD